MSSIVLSAANPLVIDPQMPENRELKRLVGDLVAKAKLALTAAAAEPTARGGDEFDALCREFVASRPAASRAVIQRRATALLANTQQRQQHFGRYAKLDLAAYRKVSYGKLNTQVGEVKLDRAVLGKLTKPVEKPSKPAVDKEAADLAAGAKYRKLRLTLHKVYCHEDSTELSESDRIAMGGSAINPKGKTWGIAEFMVSNSFDKGETKTVNRTFAEWGLVTGDGGWPRDYIAQVAMAEKDEGGFYKFLQGLWKNMSAAVLAAIGGAIGTAVGSIFPGLGNVIGAAIGAVIGAVIAWFISWFEDDIVKVRSLVLSLGSSKKSYYEWAQLMPGSQRKFDVVFDGRNNGEGKYTATFSYTVHE